MPTREYFAKVPPFPTDVPTAQLRALKLSKLLSEDENESKALYQACAELGFFLLDLRGCAEGETLLEETEAAFSISQEFFAMSDGEKSEYPLLPSNLG